MLTATPKDRVGDMCARTVQNSLRSVIVADPGSRARSRRYLQPGFGCLRCNRGRSWASARTRYLQWCLRCSRCSSRRYLVSWPSAGLPGDLRSEHLKLPDRPLRKVTWEAAATRQVPALPRPVPLPAPTDPRSSRASRPERRAARGPSTGGGAPALPVQHKEIVTESNRPSWETCSARSREAVSVHTESLVCVVARRHVYAAETPTYRALSADDFR